MNPLPVSPAFHRNLPSQILGLWARETRKRQKGNIKEWIQQPRKQSSRRISHTASLWEILKSGGSPLHHLGSVMSVRRRREFHTNLQNSEDSISFHRQLGTFRHFHFTFSLHRERGKNYSSEEMKRRTECVPTQVVLQLYSFNLFNSARGSN